MKIGLGIEIGAVFKGLGAFKDTAKSVDSLNPKISTLGKIKLGIIDSFKTLSSQVKLTTKDIEKFNSIKEKMESTNLKLDSLKNYRNDFKSSIMDKVALGTSVALPMKLAIDFESSMADVNKVVNFASNEEAKAFEQSILKMTRSIPINASGLAEIVAAGGQLGITKDKLLDFTQVTAKMSTAFDMSTAEAGESSATLMNIFGLSVSGVSSLGDALNHLSDNSASKAKDLVNVLARVGGTSKVFGITAEQTASLASAFLAMGKPAEVTGTAINALLQKLGTADKQGDKFQSALSQMGLSTQELKDNIKENAEGAIVDFLTKINGIENDEKLGLLSDMFGAEYADDIALLTTGIDNYTSAIGHLADKTKYAGSMNREFEVRSNTTANSMVLFKNGISEIGINIGSVLLPALNSVLKPLIGMTNSLASATSEYPVLTKVVFGATFGVIGLGIAFSTLGFMGSFALSGLLIARKGLLLLTAALNFAKIGVRSFIGATGIGLLVVGASLIYEHWDPIKTFFSELWDNPMKKLNEFWEGLKEKMSWAKPILMELGALFGMVSKEELAAFKKEDAQKELDEKKKRQELAKEHGIDENSMEMEQRINVWKKESNNKSNLALDLPKAEPTLNNSITIKEDKGNANDTALILPKAEPIVDNSPVFKENNNSLPEIPKVKEVSNITKVVHNTPTYHITVNNPADGFDIEAEMKKVEQKNKNKQLEDLD
ncbi:phage tail tape measure protein [Arcobacter cryaerophilus gv. pseudocryaerophilus]|uniref:Phage tail tape measure protein n=3 Tax=unclassified Arcobacter TaxID=2593671 RepID=A0AA96L703_9BACT|nr:phage tail tape measure protein [Arcobacter sp. AZ-2023]WPD04722.1 phage tail tape measure protein [Arcobacter sp. DSM 115956]WPD06817.1 phage tail tape measure protein [Arcobacter sp. DSM 115955]WNL31082.1 phage tail tape measure protein [Arcobacter sp. AZ-2023]WNP37232.1 phage tail tape measure protein [Arcobacter sp. AZ-2023]